MLIWDTSSGRQVKAFDGHQGSVRSVAFSRDGSTLASAGEDARILVWDFSTQRLAQSLTGSAGMVNSLAFDAKDRSTLFAAGEDNRLVAWNLVNGQPK